MTELSTVGSTCHRESSEIVNRVAGGPKVYPRPGPLNGLKLRTDVFINRNDTRENVFAHQTSITLNNLHKIAWPRVKPYSSTTLSARRDDSLPM